MEDQFEAGLEEVMKIEDIPAAVVHLRYDKELSIEYANQRFYEISYFNKQEISDIFHNNFESMIRKQDRNVIRDKFERIILFGGMARCEYAIELEYTTKWFILHARVFEDGKRPLLQCLIYDVSDIKEQQVLLDTVVNRIFGGLVSIFYDGEGFTIREVSDNFYTLTGINKEQYEKLRLEHPDWDLIILKGYEAELKNAMKTAIEGDGRALLECKFVDAFGQEKWIELRGVAVSRKDSGILFQFVITDITASKQVLSKMQKEKAQLDIVMELSSESMFEYDIATDVLHSSALNRNIHTGENVIEHYTDEIVHSDYAHVDDLEVMKDYAQALRNGLEQFKFEFRKFIDGKYHWIRVEGKTVYDSEQNPVRVFGKSIDIDEQKAKEEKLKLQSERDSLTKLYNHMTCVRRIKSQLENMDTTGYLLIMDIDNFKMINDSNGHLFGDAVICTFAEEISNQFKDGICGRIGGDEFLVFIQNISKENLEIKMQNLSKAMGNVLTGKNMDEAVTCSIGVAYCDPAYKEYDVLFRWADSALYQKKSNGKGGYIFADYSDRNIPKISYVKTKNQNNQETNKENSLIRTDEDLILFALEMLDNVADIKAGVDMIMRRVCNYYHIDSIIYFMKKSESRLEVDRQWESTGTTKTDLTKIFLLPEPWSVIEEKMHQNGSVVCDSDWVLQYFGKNIQNVLFCPTNGKQHYKGVVACVDSTMQRDWKKERSIISKIVSIVFTKMEQAWKYEKEQQEKEYQETHDSVTRLPHYYKFTQEAIMFANRYPERKYFVMYTDFSNFQHLNELYGYETGDEVLYQFANTLRKKCRRGIAFTRMTSDHFVALLYDDNAEKLCKYLKRIAEKFCAMINEKYTFCNLILSIGVCEWDRNKFSFTNAVDFANSARKHVKSMDVTDCIQYTEKIKSKTEVTLEIVSTMSHALENGEFYAYLQPKVNLETGKVAGAEALVRWIRPDGSMVYPDQFIPIFEKNGFVTKVDFFILEKVLQYLKDAMEKGEEVVPISVNFSRHHSKNADFVEKVVGLLAQYNVPPEMLEAEVTESVYVNDLTHLNSNIKRLKENGIPISIDDFGSGYSSLNVLAKVSADIIKLDRQFLEDCNEGKGVEFIGQVVKLMKGMGYEVIAEGVETEEQVQILKNAHCEMAQGYYYAKPMPIDEFRIFLKEYNGGKS